MNPATLPFVVDAEPDLEGLRRRAATVEDGAVCAFLGTARRHAEGREVVTLRYEAYQEMAETVGRGILEEAEARFAGARVVAQHRIGACPLGQASVAVVAVAPHRDAAFLACRYVIDEIKRRAPIWKQEVYTDGSAWVNDPAYRSRGPAPEEEVR